MNDNEKGRGGSNLWRELPSQFILFVSSCFYQNKMLTRLQRMKPPQLLLATIAISSSSWSSSIQLVESFSHYHHTQKQFQYEWAHHRFVHLPASSLSDDASGEKSSNHQSVTGPIYEMDDVPTVKLFTKQGCTLCDKVKDVSTGC